MWRGWNTLSYFTEHGDLKLFSCPCGDCGARPTDNLVRILNDVREQAGVAMVVTSGPRCRPYNITIGGATYSEHLDGDAADISATDSRTRFLIVRAAVECGINRIGIGKTFVHLGISQTNDPLVMWVY